MSTAIAVGFVIMLLITLTLIWHFFGQRGTPWGRKGHASLRIIDTLPLDPKRRLVLISRDDTHHLLLLGGPQDMVIESGITRSGGLAHEDLQRLRPLEFEPFDHRRASRP